MWAFIFIAAGIVAICAAIYLCGRVYKAAPHIDISTLSPKANRAVRMLLCAYFVLCIFVILGLLLGYINALIIAVHLLIFGLLVDLLFFIVRKASGKRIKTNFKSVVALVVTFVYLSIAFSLANCVWVASYGLSTQKTIGSLRVVMFADSHIGTTFDGEGLNEYIDRMNALSPDIVVIAGDFVDDDTSEKDLRDACAALGRLETNHGVFYAFGNHDKGYYEDSAREYSAELLVAELQKNNVTVLQDEAVLIDDRFYVVGRQEEHESRHGGAGRADISELVKDLDRSKYTIVINHQPTDYENESAANVDLVLSGHTHGGQFFPLGLFMKLFDLNDAVYGYTRKTNTDFIVTSGIADWAFKFKTGATSEFTVIDISTEK